MVVRCLGRAAKCAVWGRVFSGRRFFRGEPQEYLEQQTMASTTCTDIYVEFKTRLLKYVMFIALLQLIWVSVANSTAFRDLIVHCMAPLSLTYFVCTECTHRSIHIQLNSCLSSAVAQMLSYNRPFILFSSIKQASNITEAQGVGFFVLFGWLRCLHGLQLAGSGRPTELPSLSSPVRSQASARRRGRLVLLFFVTAEHSTNVI